MVSRHVGYLLYTWRRFHDVLMGVAYGGCSADEVVRAAIAAEQPESEETPPPPAESSSGGAESPPVDIDVDEVSIAEHLRKRIPTRGPTLPFLNAYVVPGTRLIAGEYPGAKDLTGARQTVYVHCWGGVGRTGLVVGCWLVRHGWRGAEALDEVQRLFGTMTPEKVARHPEGSPQTPGQRRMIMGWARLDQVHDGSSRS